LAGGHRSGREGTRDEIKRAGHVCSGEKERGSKELGK